MTFDRHAGRWPDSSTRDIPSFFVLFLVGQLVYGGLVYVALSALGWFNLALVLLVYVMPVIVIASAA